MTSYRYEDQPYIQDMLKFADEALKADPKGGFHAMIEHDAWCPVLHGTGLCCCNPIVRRPNRAERLRLKAAGWPGVSETN